MIIANVNSIAATLVYLTTHALERGDEDWLRRHRWWGDACARLFNDEPAVPLDG